MYEAISLWLETLADRLVATITDDDLGVVEGTVLCVGPPAYRRIDCDGRALAYVKVRPKMRYVRVELSGLWCLQLRSRLLERTAHGFVVLVRRESDVTEAVRVLQRIVIATRAQRETREVGVNQSA